MDKIDAEIRGTLLLPVVDTIEEIARAEELHGPIPMDMVRSMVILTEEVGESAEAALELGRAGMAMPLKDRRAHLRQELIQVAAVALRMVEALDGDN